LVNKKFEESLIEEIAPLFTQYVMEGVLDPKPNLEDINMDIDDLDTLLKYDYILRRDLKEFMKNLERRLRNIRTTIKKEEETFKGGRTKGKIDFSSTLKERLSSNPFDETIFVCNVIDKEFNTDENIVLKTFLKTVSEILKICDENKLLNLDYSRDFWIDENVEGTENTFREFIDGILEMNIYLRQINIEDKQVIENERLLYNVSKSRNHLYSEAAKLLLYYKKVIYDRDLDPTEAENLLKRFFKKPKEMSVLFELYWSLKIVDEFKRVTNPKFKPIGVLTTDNVIAEWKIGNYNYIMFHTTSGSKEIKINFRENCKKVIELIENSDKKIMDTFIGRELKIMEYFKEMGDEIKLWGGNQPDIILEKRDKETNDILEVFVGEVKYTDKPHDSNNATSQAKNGLKELLEYIAFIGDDDQCFEKSENLFDNLGKVKGGLFLKSKINAGKIEETGSDFIRIIHHNNEEDWDELKKMIGVIE